MSASVFMQYNKIKIIEMGIDVLVVPPVCETSSVTHWFVRAWILV